MTRPGFATSGKSLGSIEGFAGLRPADLWFKVRRTALTLASIGALIAGCAALAATQGVADPGVTAALVGGSVTDVSPSGFGWAEGIRPGQVVDVLVPAGEPGGWRIETHDQAGPHSASSSRADANLRSTVPIAICAFVVAWLSIIFLRTRRRWALPTAAIALLAASIPLQVEGSPQSSTVGLAASALLPAVAYASRLSRWTLVRVGSTGVVVGLVVAWAASRLGGFDSYFSIEPIRASVALWGTLALVFERGLLPAMTGQSLSLVRPKLFDVVVVVAVAGTAFVLGLVWSLGPLVTILLLAGLLALIPGTRHRLARPIEYLLLGDVREQAAAEAGEAERARLARELHDVSLQELAAVIRRLEIVPGTAAESENLRALAGHLRNVATELRPPVLDDLGLPAALDYLAEQASTPALPVTAAVVDDTGFGTDRRPPTEVELAMFRIASEAVSNAVRHSGGSNVRVRASVAPDRVELEVSDDGAGLPSEAARDASKRKRLGLASMRRRAEAMDAELSIAGTKGGTTVRVAWQA